jgi:ubiquitin carboxyl-terminal hydrolase 8
LHGPSWAKVLWLIVVARFDYKSELNEANPLGTSGELTRKYATLMKKMWLKTSPKRRVLVTQGFKKILAKFAPRFSGTDQQDAQEFLAYLLDGIHEDLNRVKIKPPVEFKDCDGTNDELDAIQAWHDHLLRDKSLIVDLFQGQLRSCTECRRCKLKNVRFEPFMYLSLPIDNSCQSLDDCLSLFTDEEQLIGDNRWFCHRCGEHVNATKKTDIWAMPPILIVHLKRFIYDEYDDGVKNEMELSYPIFDWDLADAVKSRGAGKPLYDLYAVANHWGELGYGHYTAYARNRMANEWYEFDDSAYQVIDIKAALEGSSTPYLLFYQMTAGDTSTKGDYTIHRQSAGLPLLYPHLENKMAKVVIETNEEGDDEDEDEEEHDGPFVRMAGRRQSAGLPSLAGGIAPGQETKSSGMMKGRLSLRVVEEEDGEDFEAVA